MRLSVIYKSTTVSLQQVFFFCRIWFSMLNWTDWREEQLHLRNVGMKPSGNTIRILGLADLLFNSKYWMLALSTEKKER